MSKIFKKPVNLLLTITNLIKPKSKKKSITDFMKHRLVFLTVPLVLLTTLISLIFYNISTSKYDLDGLFENVKTVINLPINADVESKTLNRFQKITTDLLNHNSNVQVINKYYNFVNEVLQKIRQREVKITINKDMPLTAQQKEMLFNEFKMQFPNLVKLNSPNDIKSYVLNNTQKNLDFWIQIAVAASILTISLLFYFGMKFKKLGFFSTTTVALANLVFSMGATLSTLILLTKKINLIFMIAISFYFTTSLTALFNEMKKQLPEDKKKIKLDKTSAYKIANMAINQLIPTSKFTLSIMLVALICSLIFCLIFNNLILFYFVLSAIIGICFDLFFNLFCSSQIWVLFKSKKITDKKPNIDSSKKA